MSISAAQCRAARGLVGWSQADLAQASSVGRATIADFEAGKRTPYARTLEDLRSALEEADVIFVEENGEGPGVRLRKPIYVDASASAVLVHGVTETECLTIQEAVLAFRALPKERQAIASIISRGVTFSSSEIRRLRSAPTSKAETIPLDDLDASNDE